MLTNKSLFDTLFDLSISPYTKVMPLAAIWFATPIKTAKERTARVTDGDLIKAANGKIIDCDDAPTHEVKRCMGTIGNNILYFEALNLSTNEIETITL